MSHLWELIHRNYLSQSSSGTGPMWWTALIAVQHTKVSMYLKLSPSSFCCFNCYCCCSQAGYNLSSCENHDGFDVNTILCIFKMVGSLHLQNFHYRDYDHAFHWWSNLLSNLKTPYSMVSIWLQHKCVFSKGQWNLHKEKYHISSVSVFITCLMLAKSSVIQWHYPIISQ